jgi:uncharacterized protein (DUF488 family)
MKIKTSLNLLKVRVILLKKIISLKKIMISIGNNHISQTIELKKNGIFKKIVCKKKTFKNLKMKVCLPWMVKNIQQILLHIKMKMKNLIVKKYKKTTMNILITILILKKILLNFTKLMISIMETIKS